MGHRIVYVTSHFPFGPGEAFAIPELRALLRFGIDVLVVPVRATGPLVHGDAAELIGRSRATGLMSAQVLAGALRTMLRHPIRSMEAALQTVVGQRPMVAAKNLAVLPKGLWLADLVHRERVSHVHAYWASTPGTVGMVAASASGVPFSMTAHSWDIGEANALDAKIGKTVLTRVISGDGRSEVLKQIPRSISDRVQLLHLGVDIPTETRTRTWDGTLKVLVPAGFVPFKGHAVLVEAARLLRTVGADVEIVLVGDGSLRKSIEAAAATAGVGGMVSFAGQLPHEELLARYRAGEVDVVLLSSLTLPDGSREGIPIALVEAMAHGIPVIGTTCGGIPELFGDQSGLLVPEGDPIGLADALTRLSNEPELRSSLGVAGRARVRAEFDVDLQTHRLVEIAGFEGRIA